MQCLGVTVKDTNCTPKNSAPYYKDFESLLKSYPVFTLELPFNDQGLLFNFQDRVIFIEDGGHEVTLRQANYGIFTYLQALTPGAWLILARFTIEHRYDTYSLFDLYSRYKLLDDSLKTSKWGQSDSKWEDVNQNWDKIIFDRNYLYRAGDNFLTLSPCEETISLYYVVGDVLAENYSTFRSTDSRWVKITSIQTGFNKCLGCDRKKHPSDLYKLIEIGSQGHKVEVPTRYTPPLPVYERQSLK